MGVNVGSRLPPLSFSLFEHTHSRRTIPATIPAYQLSPLVRGHLDDMESHPAHRRIAQC